MQAINENLSIDEELFCTKYELSILSGIVNEGKLERWLPGFCNVQTHNEHLARYNWVKGFVKNKEVLDIACGTGFGSYILASAGGAMHVTGYDIDENTIRYASLRNKHRHLGFEMKNAEFFEGGKEFDVIVSFETIEHLSNPDKFLNNLNRALVPKGVCFISTPIAAIPENKHPDNVYHKSEWGFKKFHDLVNRYLKIDEVYLQIYKGSTSETGFFSKVLEKTGLKQHDQVPVVENHTPQKWNPQEIKEELIGIESTGYQLLQCSKKKNA